MPFSQLQHSSAFSQPLLPHQQQSTFSQSQSQSQLLPFSQKHLTLQQQQQPTYGAGPTQQQQQRSLPSLCPRPSSTPVTTTAGWSQLGSEGSEQHHPTCSAPSGRPRPATANTTTSTGYLDTYARSPMTHAGSQKDVLAAPSTRAYGQGQGLPLTLPPQQQLSAGTAAVLAGRPSKSLAQELEERMVGDEVRTRLTSLEQDNKALVVMANTIAEQSAEATAKLGTQLDAVTSSCSHMAGGLVAVEQLCQQVLSLVQAARLEKLEATAAVGGTQGQGRAGLHDVDSQTDPVMGAALVAGRGGGGGGGGRPVSNWRRQQQEQEQPSPEPVASRRGSGTQHRKRVVDESFAGGLGRGGVGAHTCSLTYENIGI